MVTGALRGSRINVFLVVNRGKSSVHTVPAYRAYAFEMYDYEMKDCNVINLGAPGQSTNLMKELREITAFGVQMLYDVIV